MAVDFPDIPISSSRFGLRKIQASFESSFSRRVSTLFHAGGKTDRWEGIYTTPALNHSQARLLRAFLTQLKGQTGTFKAFNPDRKKPSTYSAADLLADSTLETADMTIATADSDDFPGLGKVDGAGQTGHILNTKDWPGSSTVLKAGDFFQVGSQLFMVIADVTSDGLGKAAISLEPAIRVSPLNDADIIIETPVMIARLSNPVNPIDVGLTATTPVSFAFEEVL